MSNIVLSIIVTGFNVSKYIKDALNSVLNQEFTIPFEVIAVDDVSKDNTYDIMKSYTDKFKTKNIAYTAIQSPVNGGVAYARARGLDVAKGRYTLFLDGDDYFLGNDKLNTIVNTALRDDLDCVIFNYTGSRFQQEINIEDNKNLTGREAVKKYFKNDFPAMVWLKLWTTSILKAYPFDYIRYYEDLTCTPIWIALSKKVLYTKEVAYYYRNNPFSVSNRIKAGHECIKAKDYCKHYFSNSPDILILI